MALALTTGKRTLAADGDSYNYLFEKPVKDDLIIMQDGTVEQTVAEMVKLVEKYNYQTARLAKLLQGKTVQESASNIWQFIYKNIQYREDKAGVEQLRTPARTWAERKSGADCDCMSIFAASLLTNMGIAHQFRIVKYGKPDYQHVYVVIPQKGLNGKHIVIDGVLDKFNYELDFTQKKDFMAQLGIPIQILNGVEGSLAYDETRLLAYVRSIRNAVIRNPEQLLTINWRNALEFLDYILHNWNNPKNRVQAIRQVANTEAKQFPNSRLFRTILAYVDGRATCDDVKAQTWFSNATTTVAGLGKGKNVWAEVGLALPRQAYLLLLRANAFHWAEKLVVGFFGGLNDQTKGVAQWEPNRAKYAAAFGMTTAQQRKQRDNLLKILNVWHDKLGGDWSTLKRAAMDGSSKLRKRVENLPGYRYWYNFDDWGGKPTGSGTAQNPVGLGGIESDCNCCNGASLGSLGIATETILTSAAAIIAALAPIMMGLIKPGNADSSISDSGDPYANSDLLAQLEAEARNQNSGNPDYGTSSSSIKTVGIIAGVLALIGGAYMLLKPDDKKSKSRSNAK